MQLASLGVKTLSFSESRNLGVAWRGPQNAIKTLSGDLGSWLEHAYAYREWLTGVLEGHIKPRPEEKADIPKDPRTFLLELENQIQWSLRQLGNNWDPASTGPQTDWDTSREGGGEEENSAPRLPSGAVEGTSNNLVWNQGTTHHITFVDEDRIQDIFGEDITLDISSSSAKVSAKIDLDKRMKPEERVLIITVRDELVNPPREATYYVHDMEFVRDPVTGQEYVTNPHVKIRTPKKSQVSDQTDSFDDKTKAKDPGLVSWERFEGNASDLENSGREGLDSRGRPPQSKPDETDDKGYAYYRKDTEVFLTADYDDELRYHFIYAPGRVALSASEDTKYQDEVKIFAWDDGKYSICIIKGGDPSKVEWFNLQGSPGEILLDVAPGQIRYYKGSAKEEDAVPYRAGMDPRIKVRGEKTNDEADSNDLDDDSGEENRGATSSFGPEFDAMVRIAGITPEEALKAFEQTYKLAFGKEADLKAWIKNKNNWLKNPPDSKLVELVFRSNPELKSQWEGLSGSKLEDVKEKVGKIREVIIDTLKAFYPGTYIAPITGTFGEFRSEGTLGSYDTFDAMGIKFGDRIFSFYHLNPEYGSFPGNLTVPDLRWSEVTENPSYKYWRED